MLLFSKVIQNPENQQCAEVSSPEPNSILTAISQIIEPDTTYLLYRIHSIISMAKSMNVVHAQRKKVHCWQERWSVMVILRYFGCLLRASQSALYKATVVIDSKIILLLGLYCCTFEAKVSVKVLMGGVDIRKGWMVPLW